MEWGMVQEKMVHGMQENIPLPGQKKRGNLPPSVRYPSIQGSQATPPGCPGQPSIQPPAAAQGPPGSEPEAARPSRHRPAAY